MEIISSWGKESAILREQDKIASACEFQNLMLTLTEFNTPTYKLRSYGGKKVHRNNIRWFLDWLARLMSYFLQPLFHLYLLLLTLFSRKQVCSAKDNVQDPEDHSKEWPRRHGEEVWSWLEQVLFVIRHSPSQDRSYRRGMSKIRCEWNSCIFEWTITIIYCCKYVLSK